MQALFITAPSTPLRLPGSGPLTASAPDDGPITVAIFQFSQ